MKITYAPGATPITDDDLEGLIPNVSLQAELNEFEAANIAQAELWAPKSRNMKRDLLSVTGLKNLHKKMFGETWKWAGELRKSQTIPGVEVHRIQSELGRLLGDVNYWIENKTFSLDEIAIRFHHRLVWIHPFPNGNGRFSRFAADLLLIYNKQLRFTWGSANLIKVSDERSKYIKALQKADKDNDNIQDLLRFARS